MSFSPDIMGYWFSKSLTGEDLHQAFVLAAAGENEQENPVDMLGVDVVVAKTQALW